MHLTSDLEKTWSGAKQYLFCDFSANTVLRFANYGFNDENLGSFLSAAWLGLFCAPVMSLWSDWNGPLWLWLLEKALTVTECSAQPAATHGWAKHHRDGGDRGGGCLPWRPAPIFPHRSERAGGEISLAVCLNIKRANRSNLIFLIKHSLPVHLFLGGGGEG